MKIFFGFFNPFFLCVLDKGYNSVEAAENLLRMGMGTDDQISMAIGLPLEKVQEIAEQLRMHN